jgi:hypothetical protein
MIMTFFSVFSVKNAFKIFDRFTSIRTYQGFLSV